MKKPQRAQKTQAKPSAVQIDRDEHWWNSEEIDNGIDLQPEPELSRTQIDFLAQKSIAFLFALHNHLNPFLVICCDKTKSKIKKEENVKRHINLECRVRVEVFAGLDRIRRVDEIND